MAHKGVPSKGCKQRLSTASRVEITQNERVVRHQKMLQHQQENAIK